MKKQLYKLKNSAITYDSYIPSKKLDMQLNISKLVFNTGFIEYGFYTYKPFTAFNKLAFKEAEKLLFNLKGILIDE